MKTLFAAGLILEPLTIAHAEAMSPILSESELYRFLDYGPPPSLEHVRGVYSQLQQRASPDGTEIWLNWIVRLGSRQPIGFVQATLVPEQNAWVAFIFGSAYWGHGYARTATQAMLAHLAENYGTQVFLATVEISNARSIALLAHLGFEPASPEDAARHELSNTEMLFKRQARHSENAP